jgi:hypothetical protein
MEIKPWHIVVVFVAVVGGVVTFFVSSKLRSRKEITKEMVLPSELNQRAELFTKAWLHNDWALLRRLVRPGMDKSAYSWSVHNAPPDSVTAENVAGQLRIEAIVANMQSGRADVTVHFTDMRSNSQPLLDFPQSWVQVAGTWYFVVPE